MRNMIDSILKKIPKVPAVKWIGKKVPIFADVYLGLRRLFKPPMTFTTVKVQGNIMYVDVNSNFKTPLGSDHYERYETSLFQKEVKEGMTVVDLGAHIGYYTLIAARLVGKNGRVFSFEPEPDNYSLLVKSIEANGYKNITPVQKAVSDKVGTTKLFVSPTDAGVHSIYNPHEWRKCIEVETVTLDGFFGEGKDRIDVIKMDIEGAEPAALQGMRKILTKNRDIKIFSEFFPEPIRRGGCSPEEYLNELVNFGFTIFNIDERKEEIKPCDIVSLMRICSDKGINTNLLCVRL